MESTESLRQKICELEKLVETLEATIRRQDAELRRLELELQRQQKVDPCIRCDAHRISMFSSCSDGSQYNPLQKELERATESLERCENAIVAAKIRELQQYKKSEKDYEEIAKSLTRRRSASQKSSKTRNAIGHTKRLRDGYVKLVENIRAEKVAAIMYQRGALTLSELESVQLYRNAQARAAKVLIDILIGQDSSMYECFLQALKETDQEDIYVCLVYQDYGMEAIERGHADTIRRNYIFLEDKMDTKYSGLLGQLFADRVLDTSEKDQIESEQGLTRQNQLLLSMLSRKCTEQFDKFIGALEKTDQTFVADVLRAGYSYTHDLPQTVDYAERFGENCQRFGSKLPPLPPPRSKPFTHHLRPRSVPSPPEVDDVEIAIDSSDGAYSIPIVPNEIVNNDQDTTARTKKLNVNGSRETPLPSLIIQSASCPDMAAATLSPTTQVCWQHISCVVVGDPDVDKTCLIANTHDCDSVHQVVHLTERRVQLGNDVYSLVVTDTAGLEDLDRMMAMQCQMADVFVVCFSVFKPKTLDSAIHKWIPGIRSNCAGRPVIMVGIKETDVADQSTSVAAASTARPMSSTCLREMANNLNIAKYLEFSPVTGRDVDEVFTAAVEATIKARRRSDDENRGKSLFLFGLRRP